MKTFRIQLKQMLRSWEFQISFLLMTLFSVGSFCSAVRTSSSQAYDSLYDAECYICTNYRWEWILWGGLLFIVTVMPYSASYMKESKNGNLIPLIMRSSRRDYFLSKMLVTAVGNALVLGIPILLNYLLCWIYFPHNEKSLYWSTRVYRDEVLMGGNLLYQTDYPQMFFGKLYVYNPWLFHLWMLFLLMVFAAVMGCLALCLSFLFRRGRILLFLPWFLISKLLSSVDMVMFDRAMEYADKKYFCYNIFSYLHPFGVVPGMSSWYFLAFLTGIAGICILLLVYVIRSGNRILTGE